MDISKKNVNAVLSFICSFMVGVLITFGFGFLFCIASDTRMFLFCVGVAITLGICGWSLCRKNNYDGIYIGIYISSPIQSIEPIKEEYKPKKRLGDISAKYESNGSVRTVSKGINDPGGVSYGSYQLSSKVGTMTNFLQSVDGMQFLISNVKHSYGLDINKISSDEFNKNYQKICDYQRNKMEDAQHSFIKKTHYMPLLNKVSDLGYNVKSNKMKEAIWSMSVQHGGAFKIFKTVKNNNNNNIQDMSLETLIKELYREREIYALKYTPKSWHVGLKRRYKAEVQDLLNMSDSSFVL